MRFNINGFAEESAGQARTTTMIQTWPQIILTTSRSEIGDSRNALFFYNTKACLVNTWC